MVQNIVDVLALLVAGLMVGNELTVALFLHPTISRLADEVHAPSRNCIRRAFRTRYAFLVCRGPVIVRSRGLASLACGFGRNRIVLGSDALFAIAIVYTLIFPAPLNRRIATWKTASLPSSWHADRRRWDLLHWIRMAILLPALIALIAGVVVSHCG